MKKFKWIIGTTILYFIVAIIDVFFLPVIPFELLQVLWVVVLSMPWWNKRVQTWLGV